MLVFLMYFLFNGTLMACMKPAIGGPSLSPWTEVIFQQCEMRLEDRKRFFFFVCLFVCLFVLMTTHSPYKSYRSMIGTLKEETP